MAGAAANGHIGKHYLKGQKMKIDNGDRVIIMDFDAQTVTSINNSRKTYSVTKFSDLGQSLSKADVGMNVDFKETGKKKNINGYNAHEAIMTMEMDSPQSRKAGVKMQMEMDMWLSRDVPGAQELRAFHQRNAGRFPWAAITGNGGNPSTQKAMAEMQRKMASLDAVPVLQVIRMKTAGNEAQMAQAQQGMEQARARLEEMKKQGGQQAAMAEQALARMGAGAAGGSMFETTVESSNFSTSPIPDSTFAVPAGYQLTQK